MHTQGAASKTTDEVAGNGPKRASHEPGPVRASNSVYRLLSPRA